MEKEIIKSYIRKANPWWDEDYKFDFSYKEREAYKEIAKYLPQRQIVALTGLRRVGKTTLMLKVIKEKIKQGFPRKNIFYFSFDEFSNIRIMDLVDIYGELIAKMNKSEKYIFVLDEVQKIKSWSEQIKVIYDLNLDLNLKFIVSGSESLFIRKKSRESLAGRIYEFRINPMTFKEFLDFKDIKIDNLFIQKEKIIDNFKSYLLTNGFPEIAYSKEEECRKYIKEGVIDKTLYRDLTEVFDIKNISLVKSIFNLIYENPGQIININELAKELGFSRQLVSTYLEYLEESFLIKKLYNYSRNARKTQRRLKRYYPTLINPLLIKDDFGKIFEQVMVIQLNADYFWRDPFKNEVDIIKTEPLIAIEVKSGEIKEGNLKSLKKFIEKFKPKQAIVISYDAEREMDSIKVIPFYAYLLKSL